MDVKFLERIPGTRKRRYQFTAIDECTRIRVLKVSDVCWLTRIVGGQTPQTVEGPSLRWPFGNEGVIPLADASGLSKRTP